MPRREVPITPVELIPQPGTASGVGGLVEDTLLRFLQRVVNTAGETVSEVIEWGLEIWLEAIEEALIDVNRPLIQSMLNELPPGSPIAPFLRAMLGSESVAGVVSLGSLAGAAAGQTASSIFQVLLRPVQYEMDTGMRTARLDASAAITGVWREVLSRGNMQDQLSDLGWSTGNIGVWEEILKPLINEADILTLWLREEIGEGEARDRLIKRGYDSTKINHMLTVMRPLIGPDDLRSLMFRDIISPGAFADRLGHHGYTPQQVSELTELSWRLLAPGDIVERWRRGKIENGEAIRRFAAHGYTPDIVTEILEVGRPLSGLGELRELYWREDLSEGDFKDRVSQFGYDEEQVNEIEKLTHRIPGPGDLISMAVREAFRPAIVSEYKYLAEFPDEFAEWMEKQGFDKEWAEKWWIAHWRLPSLTMAYDMFHRRIITEEDMERLFAVSDIAPFWRPKLKEAAYRPLTRVDVRRMYGLGVLDESAVYNSYLDLGYSPDNAAYMTEFTIKYTTETERDATKTDILRAYSEGVISRGTAKTYLIELGYSETWAEYYLELEDLKKERGLLSVEISLLKSQYIEGIISRTDVYEALGKWNLPDAQIRTLLASWDLAKERMITIPSVGQLEAFLKQEIISEGQYRELMEKRHYPPETVSYFLQEIRVQIAELAIKEEERARKEEERVRLAEVKTTYEVERASFDVEIAELKTALAEFKVLLGIVVDLDLIDEIFRETDNIKLRIVELQEAKAKRKLELTETLRGMVV